MSFTSLNLHANINKALSQCGYKIPTPIQAKAIPDILKGADVVACAQTGTGKTAAFVLPALHLLTTQPKSNQAQILILTPTRELANQISQAIQQYGKFLRVQVAKLIGGSSYGDQFRSLSRPLDIIVATPGRLLDHLERGKVDLSHIKMMVLDEADRMLDMGFIDDVREIAKATPHKRQTLLFSATIDNRLAHLIQKLLKNPINIDLSQQKNAPSQIQQALYHVDNLQHKMQLLEHFLTNERVFKGIIFTATKISADQLAKQLQQKGFHTAPLHGDLRQSMRNKTVERLRQGKIQYLVATDVAARGIDIQDVTHVFNYDLPKFSEDYVHRIGRTGRAGKKGMAISFANSTDKRHIQKIERYTQQKLPVLTIPGLEPKACHSDKTPPKRGHKKKNRGHQRKFSGKPTEAHKPPHKKPRKFRKKNKVA